MVYDYTIYPENSLSEFQKACAAIEKAFPDSQKLSLLIDVDGSMIQTYTFMGKDIDIFNDYDVGAVFIQSEICLDKVFNYHSFGRENKA